MASAAGSLFARIYAGPHRRRPVHDRRVRHLPGSLRRRHLHRQGPLRRRRVHGGARGLACPRTRCCRTTCSKACTRAPRWSPTSRSSTTIRRACSRTRDGSTAGSAATGRSCCGCSRSCRRARGLKRNSLPLISRWKILDNLRRSLVAPMLLALLVAGWTVLPGAHWFWTATVLAVMASQLLPLVAQMIVGPRRAQSYPVFWRNLRRRLGDCARAGRARRHVSRLSRLGHGARDRADAGPSDDHEAPAARVGDRCDRGGARGGHRRRTRAARDSSPT